ncbi:MAG: hypothetical protein VKP70_08845 [Cyanobacteriota bacterium]|nr:hypothetical protein [Cyanobacteriota bacterium]
MDQEFLDASREAEDHATLAAAEIRLAEEQAQTAGQRSQVAERDNRLVERAASNRRKLSVVLSMGMVDLTGLIIFA